jgi:hypothetical protein
MPDAYLRLLHVMKPYAFQLRHQLERAPAKLIELSVGGSFLGPTLLEHMCRLRSGFIALTEGLSGCW